MKLGFFWLLIVLVGSQAASASRDNANTYCDEPLRRTIVTLLNVQVSITHVCHLDLFQ